MIKYDLLPQFILDNSISLKELGVFEYAWKSDDIKKIIEILDEKRIPILGGDVYKVENGKACQTYDSWYINISNEWDFYSKSYEKAMSYILNYEKKNKGKFIYSIVF